MLIYLQGLKLFIEKRNILNIGKVKKLVNKPDFIIGYFANNFFSIKDLYDLQVFYQVPVILFMADMVKYGSGT